MTRGAKGTAILVARARTSAVAVIVVTVSLAVATSASALTQVSAPVEQSGEIYVGEANCPSGRNAVSGGFAGPDQVAVSVNRRAGRDSWLVEAGEAGVTAYAYCSRRLSPSVKSRGGRIHLATDEMGGATARCERGATAIAGGWSFTSVYSNQTAFTSYGAGGRAWRVFGGSGESARITAYAYCLRSDRIEARTRTGESIGAGASDGVTTNCRTGEELLGGGFMTQPAPDWDNATGPDLFFNESRREGARAWTSTAHNYSAVAGRIKLAVLCR